LSLLGQRVKIQVPKLLQPIYTKDLRYYFLKGGRASGKSWAVADRMLYELVLHQDKTLLCIREIQKSIKFSSKKLIEERIAYHGLHPYFEILDTEIRCKMGKGQILFTGMQNHTADSVKSMEGINLVWCEEAMNLSQYSLEILIPTIRKQGSKLFFTFNPRHPDDPIELLMHDTAEEDKVVVHINYIENPFCSEEIIKEAEEMKTRRPKKYDHIYLGQHGVAEGLIFEHTEVRMIREDEVKGLECVQGMDFGFTNDPTTFSINYIDHKNKKLYVFDGFSKRGMANSEIADKIKRMRAHTHITRCDSAEPKTIAHLRTLNINAIGAEKGKDSVSGGISYMQEFDIIINAHLTPFIASFSNYSWEIDKLTGKPKNKPNHDFSDEIDSVRYSLSHLYKRRWNAGRVSKPIGI